MDYSQLTKISDGLFSSKPESPYAQAWEKFFGKPMKSYSNSKEFQNMIDCLKGLTTFGSAAEFFKNEANTDKWPIGEEGIKQAYKTFVEGLKYKRIASGDAKTLVNFFFASPNKINSKSNFRKFFSEFLPEINKLLYRFRDSRTS